MNIRRLIPIHVASGQPFIMVIEIEKWKVGAGNLVYGRMGRMWAGLVLVGDLQLNPS